MGEYDDIINLKRPSSKRMKMDIIQRANIFNPYAALEGYASVICEAGREVDKKEELTEDKLSDLNAKLNSLIDKLPQFATVVYFVPDNVKNGGKYLTIIGNITKYNINDRFIVVDGVKISFDNLYQIFFE